MTLLIDPFLVPCYRSLYIYILPPVYIYICQWYLLHNSSHEILLLVMTPVDIQRALSNSTLWGSKHLHVVCSICSTLLCTRRMISMSFGVAVYIGLLHLCLFILHLRMQPWCQTCTLPHCKHQLHNVASQQTCDEKNVQNTNPTYSAGKVILNKNIIDCTNLLQVSYRYPVPAGLPP